MTPKKEIGLKGKLLGYGDEQSNNVAVESKKKEERGTINLTVDPNLKWNFKEWCVRHKITQVEAFKQGYDLLREKYGD